MVIKTLIVICFLGLSAFTTIPDIYNITVRTLNGESLSLYSYSGKKIVVIEFDVADYDESQLRMLDTIEKNNNNIKVFAIPAKDFNAGTTTQSVQTLIDNLNLSFVVTEPSFIKKSATPQMDLFAWLTHVEQNGHFDNDADKPGQIYLIDETGILYALLEKGTSNALIKQIISQ
jgi:glutathione peroxidase